MKVRVKLQKKVDESYDLLIGKCSPAALGKQIVADGFGKSYCVVTDSRVSELFGKKLVSSIKGAGAKAELVVFPAGEANKNMKTVSLVLEQMLGFGFDRQSCVVALGGGIVGDVAGFCASIYLRGIRFVQVPTTLLAMVDSSIGGKTGVNLSGGKNSAGTFSQPKRVYICPEFLEGLGKEEIASGLAEVVKHAVLTDPKYFAFLEKNTKKILSLDRKTLATLIVKNCEIKARVVEKDEKEGNYRQVVNFGHTIGHAIEVLGKYKKFRHGEAISIGMVAEAQISRLLGLMGEDEVEKTRSLLHKIGLPVRLPREKKYSFARIIAATKKDKKAKNGKAYYALPARIGRMHSQGGSFAVAVSDDIVMSALEAVK
ncbi:MAG: 3-dehydroquinate synthase [archaeon]|nr:3-dehydroquinate synthase [archaeon]